MKVELLSITPDAESIIEQAGRTCYQSEVGDKTIIQRWIKSGHHSVLEHGYATFRISEVSRALTHQLVRHRLSSFSQQSQRYVSENNFDYVIPESIEKNEDAFGLYNEIMEMLQLAYKDLVSFGIKKEDARMILPNACNTEIVMSANFRQWRNIFKLRLDKHAQKEIRDLCEQIYIILYEHAPNVFFDIKGETK